MRRLLSMTLLAAGLLLMCAAPARAQQGRSIFEGKGNCWTCHGRDGRGTPLGPDLSDAEWLNIDGSLDSIRSIVRAGVPRPKRYPVAMPPMGGAKLSRTEIDAVAAYIRALGERAQR